MSWTTGTPQEDPTVTSPGRFDTAQAEPAAPAYADSGLAFPPPMVRPRLNRPGFFREVLDTVVLIGAIYALVNLATVRFFIDGPSMQPNFHAEQFLLISRLSFMFGNPERGDIVVFNAPGSHPDDPPLIKRAIGLPGDTIALRDGSVYVNGTLLDEPYTLEPCRENRCRDESWTLGTDEYFFMGDNRNNSRDSRAFGPVVRSSIVGEALVRYWPPQDWGIVEHYRFPEPVAGSS